MLYSVNLNKDNDKKKFSGIQKLSLNSLISLMKKKKVVKVVTCYYGIKTLNDFLSELKGRDRSTDIILCATGVAKENWITQIESLIDEKCGLKLGNGQNVYLYTKFTLLHSKIYFSKNKYYNSAQAARCLLGSANLSQNAFECNEEILADIVDGDTKNAVENYIDEILKDKENLFDIREIRNKKRNEGEIFDLSFICGEHNQYPTSVQDYLLSGFLAFKCSRSFSLGFGNNEWRKEINSNSTGSKYFKDTKTLNLAAILGVDGLDEIQDDDADVDESLEENDSSSKNQRKKTRIPIRSNSIETCFGYWIPRDRYEIIQEKKNNTNKLNDYNQIIEALKANKDDLKPEVELKLNEAFAEVNLNEERRKYYLPKILNHLKTKLNYYSKKNNKKLYLDSCYCITPMPNLFEDPVTRNEFIESFWEDVCIRSRCKIVKNKKDAKNLFRMVYSLLCGNKDEILDLTYDLNELEGVEY